MELARITSGSISQPVRKNYNNWHEIPTGLVDSRAIFIVNQIEKAVWIRRAFFSPAKLNEGRRSSVPLTGGKYCQGEKGTRR